MQEGDKSLDMLNMCNLDGKCFTSSPVTYITADVKKVVSDLFHLGSTLVESEFIKSKMRLSE